MLFYNPLNISPFQIQFFGLIVDPNVGNKEVFMKIAICAVIREGNKIVADSLANSDIFILFDLNKNDISERIINNKYKFSINPEIFCAQLIISKGVQTVVCGNFEDDAIKLFSEAKIKVIRHNEEDVGKFLICFLSNYVRD